MAARDLAARVTAARRTCRALLAAGLALAGLAPLASATAPRADDVEAAALDVLARHCQRCHGPDKQKGSLRLDDLDHLLDVVPPDAPADGLLWERVSLPREDIDVMPPDDPLPAEALEALRIWIEAGAPLESFERRQALSAEELAAEAALLDELRAATGALVLPLAQGDPRLRVDYGRGSGPVTEDALRALTPVARRVHELSLAGRDLDVGVLAALPALPELERLHLERTGLTDADVTRLLGTSPKVRYLNLHSTHVSDTILGVAVRMKVLRRLVLFDTRVSDEMLGVIGRAYPHIEVTGDLELPEAPERVEGATVEEAEAADDEATADADADADGTATDEPADG